jgi:glycerophosphoryl diester phosphodiesterase
MTLVIAHRGASAYAPENTLAAFDLAVQQGADMLELDVQQTRDGQLAVFHDTTTKRWNGQDRRVSDCTFVELQALDLGAGQRVPTLADVCALARETGVRLNVEIKGQGFGGAVARLVRAENVGEHVLFSSFWPAALEEAAAADPDLPRALLTSARRPWPLLRPRTRRPLRALRRLRCVAWHPAYRTPFLARDIARVRRAGLRVNVWTVNDPAAMRRLAHLPVDGIITDRPDVLRAVLQRR